MNFQRAYKRELLQIALHEYCDLSLKYEALRELQRRGKSKYPETVRKYDGKEERTISELYLKGFLLRDIARRFGRSKQAICDKLGVMHKNGLPYRKLAIWTKSGYEPGRKTS
ncbi:hypothetical protein [Paenibacillus crassostreae]|uniref:Resolvase HTH domain-containing protein n=1 Tax=Paenibacillus crassostreae TaxID=1763538 RepID=A0A167C6C3_9BACL|nr:hypothetical protein [Paenibacillus crassostreae]AOZ91591.1 hypothetical protein LPB68_04755 [Paenibacillus crassostreae]OAB72834.1 hypothetical protein PNBC_15495 [Paenibacillus crassostreae]